MKLIPIEQHPDAARILYELLAERRPEESISHKKMPTWEEHCAFIASKPYAAWYLIENASGVVGTVYLSKNDEIGVFIFRLLQRYGFGPEAVLLLMELHGNRPYLANINPANKVSRRMFEKLGFRHIQDTLKWFPPAHS